MTIETRHIPTLPKGYKLHVKRFDELTNKELYELLRIRSSVFIVEQNCVYQDLDQLDFSAIHLWITKGENTIAMCRICSPGTYMEALSLGRIISTERGKGYGMLMVKVALDVAKEYFPDASCIEIKAQTDKAEFYEKFGFKSTSDPFMFEGLSHTCMRKDSAR